MFQKEYILFYNGKNKFLPQIKYSYTIIWKTLVYLEICDLELVIIKCYLIKALITVTFNFVLILLYYVYMNIREYRLLRGWTDNSESKTQPLTISDILVSGFSIFAALFPVFWFVTMEKKGICTFENFNLHKFYQNGSYF